ncbi:hypothetical protein ACOMHN_006796 [Nucella lapillus]
MSVDCADPRRDGFSAQSVDPPGVSTVGMAKPLAESADPADPTCAGSVDSASDDWPVQVDSADEHVGPIDPAPRSRVGPVARVGPTETASDHWVDPVDSASDDWPGQVDSADEHVGPIDPAPRSRVGSVDTTPGGRVGPVDTASGDRVGPHDDSADRFGITCVI